MYLNFADTREWRTRASSAAEAVSSIRPGDHVFVGTACATPQTLVDALERLDKPPAGVVLTHYLADRVGSYETHYRHRFFFVGRDIRGTRAPTQLEYLALSLADAPALLRQRPDARGRGPDPGCPAGRGRDVQPRNLGRRHARGGACRPLCDRRGQPGDAADARRQRHPARADRPACRRRAAAGRIRPRAGGWRRGPDR